MAKQKTVCLCSYVQKYRLGKSQQPESCSDNKEKGNFNSANEAIIALYMLPTVVLICHVIGADYGKIQTATDGHFSREVSDAAHNQINE